jgi:hypothetical protein
MMADKSINNTIHHKSTGNVDGRKGSVCPYRKKSMAKAENKKYKT